MSKNKTIEQGLIPEIVQSFAEYVHGCDGMMSVGWHVTMIWRELKEKYPQLKNKEVCANCGGNMAAYWYALDPIDASAMVKLGRVVRFKTDQNMTLSDANRLHIVKLETLTDAERHRTTKLRFLGLIAKIKTANGAQEKGLWLITRRGFEFLHNEPVPARVKARNNKIEERTEGEDKITLHELIERMSDPIALDNLPYYQRETAQGALL